MEYSRDIMNKSIRKGVCYLINDFWNGNRFQYMTIGSMSKPELTKSTDKG